MLAWGSENGNGSASAAAIHLCYGDVKYMPKGPFCIYQSTLLEDTKLHTKCINGTMNKTYVGEQDY